MHTPLPWRVKPRNPHKVEGSPFEEGTVVASTWRSLFSPPPDEAAGNAALIVRAVNAHAELLAALERIVAAWESIPENAQVNEEMNLDGMWANARTAIEKAKGA